MWLRSGREVLAPQPVEPLLGHLVQQGRDDQGRHVRSLFGRLPPGRRPLDVPDVPREQAADHGDRHHLAQPDHHAGSAAGTPAAPGSRPRSAGPRPRPSRRTGARAGRPGSLRYSAASSSARCGCQLCCAARVSGRRPRSAVTRTRQPDRPGHERLLDSSRNRGSPLTNVRARPIPNTSSITVANGFSTRCRSATSTTRTRPPASRPSRATQSETPSRCSA